MHDDNYNDDDDEEEILFRGLQNIVAYSCDVLASCNAANTKNDDNADSTNKSNILSKYRKYGSGKTGIDIPIITLGLHKILTNMGNATDGKPIGEKILPLLWTNDKRVYTERCITLQFI